MKIRKATKKDLKEVIDIMLTEFSKPPFNERVNFQDALKSLRFYFKLGEIYVAVIDKKIVGIVIFKIEQYWEGKVLIIEDLAVREEFKEQEVGKKLMNFVESYSKKKNIKRVLFITNKKSKALGFYKRLGYKEGKNRINMEKKLKWKQI